ncbi:MAG: YeeE/YedE family protein [Cocleimonas sp.]|nr:YeeE/YedE family protein [Cocleimonas sp.]
MKIGQKRTNTELKIEVEQQMHLPLLKILSVILGTVFGILLVSIGGTSFDIMAGMFLFENFQLPIVLGLAVMSGALGMALVKRMKANSIISQKEITFGAVKFSRRVFIGALLFGTGWALTASCPGTAMVMIGEGKMTGIFVVAGIIIGTVIFGYFNRNAR